jgi:hypothetical protein
MFKTIMNFFETIGRARAATRLAAAGHYDLAKELMLKD